MTSKMLIILLFALNINLGCSPKEQKWIGIAYPNRSDLKVAKEVGIFSDLNVCEATAKSVAGPEGDFECIEDN
jgi:hypothetical protein